MHQICPGLAGQPVTFLLMPLLKAVRRPRKLS